MSPAEPLAGEPLVWRPREPPLVPVAVCAFDASAAALGRRLLADSDEQLARLHAVAGAGVLLVLGAPEDLPWVDGARYLGRDPAAPSLLVPTELAPSIHVALLDEAVRRRAAAGEGGARRDGARGGWAIVPSSSRLVHVATAAPIARAPLRVGGQRRLTGC